MKLLKEGPAPDAVLLDISLPKLLDIEATRQPKDIDPEVEVLGLNMHKLEGLPSMAGASSMWQLAPEGRPFPA